MAFKATCTTLAKVADDEPIFVLRAKDRLASMAVREWAERAELSGSPEAKVQEALRCAEAMDEWAEKNGDKVPD